MILNNCDRLIVALDYTNLNDVKKIVTSIGDKVNVYKVGLELFLNTRGEAIDYLHSLNKKVFLDLKFHDIPNTTAMASLFAIKEKVFMFNVHCSIGVTAMEKVVTTIKTSNSNSLCIGVTVLTSFSDKEIMEQFKTSLNASELATHLAVQSKNAGLNGVVCSPIEAKKIKNLCGNDFYTICPGVRPSFASVDDQKRIMTPKDAIKNGADFLVIGRPITKSHDPIKAIDLIINEIEEGLLLC